MVRNDSSYQEETENQHWGQNSWKGKVSINPEQEHHLNCFNALCAFKCAPPHPSQVLKYCVWIGGTQLLKTSNTLFTACLINPVFSPYFTSPVRELILRGTPPAATQPIAGCTYSFHSASRFKVYRQSVRRQNDWKHNWSHRFREKHVREKAEEERKQHWRWEHRESSEKTLIKSSRNWIQKPQTKTCPKGSLFIWSNLSSIKRSYFFLATEEQVQWALQKCFITPLSSLLLISSIFITLSSRHPTSAQRWVWYIRYWANLPLSLVGPPPAIAHAMSSHVPHHLQTLQVCSKILGPSAWVFPPTPLFSDFYQNTIVLCS